MLKFNVGDRVIGLPFNEPETDAVARWRRRMSEAHGTVKSVDYNPDTIYQCLVQFDNGCEFWCRKEWIVPAEPLANMNVTSEDLMEILK